MNTFSQTALALVMVATVAPALAEEYVYAGSLPETSATYANGFLPFFDAVREGTNGHVDIKYFGNETLGKTSTLLSLVENGAADMAQIIDIYIPADLPVSALLSDAFVYGEDARIMAGAVNAMRLLDCPECTEEFAAHKMINFGSYSLSPYHFYCKGKKLETPGDFVGVKVRATSGAGQLVAGMGGTPVNIPYPETYEALQRGQVDCVAGSIALIKSYSLWDEIENINMLPVGTYHGSHLFNMRLDRWQALSSADRRVMLDAAPMAISGGVRGYVEDDQIVTDAAGEKGFELYQPSDSFVQAFDAYKIAERPNIVERGAKRGVADADGILARFETHIAEWTDIVNAIKPVHQKWGDADWVAYAAALKTGVFDKVSAD